MANDRSDRTEGTLRPLVTVKVASQLLGLCERKIGQLADAGEIPRVRIGRSVRFRPEDLKAFIERNVRRGVGGAA